MLTLPACQANAPGKLETEVADQAKKITIGGKDRVNPLPDNDETQKKGAEHFQHHCQVCHGLDGHATGVPFAGMMSPPVPDLAKKDIQDYSDGQLMWIIENGIRLTGMPGWQGMLDDDEMWSIVRYLRHLPPAGSLGTPAVYQESEAEHKEAEHKKAGAGEKHGHTHQHSGPH